MESKIITLYLQRINSDVEQAAEDISRTDGWKEELEQVLKSNTNYEWKFEFKTDIT